MNVLAHQRKGQFLGLRLADEARAFVQKFLDGGGGFSGCKSARREFGIAAAGRVSRHVENILHAQRETGKDAGRRVGNGGIRVIEEGVQFVARSNHRSFPFDVNGKVVQATRICKRCDFFH